MLIVCLAALVSFAPKVSATDSGKGRLLYAASKARVDASSVLAASVVVRPDALLVSYDVASRTSPTSSSCILTPTS